MACPYSAKLRLIRAFESAGIPASRWRRSVKTGRVRGVSTILRGRSSRAWRKLQARLADPRFRSIEDLRFFTFGGILQRLNLGKQAVAAEAPFLIGRHRDVRQFRAPAPAFLLAGHRGSALRAAGFHRAMMAQLWRGVQRRVQGRSRGFLVSRTTRMIS